MTTALAHAATPADVGGVCLEHTRSAVGAIGGFVVRAPSEGVALRVISSDGDLGDVDIDELTLDSDTPVARAIRTGEPVWQLDREASVPRAPDSVTFVALPFGSGSRVLGAVQLAFRGAFQPAAEVRDRLETIVAQCALALERSFLLDSELRLRRSSERLQSITAELSNALTRADVARVLLDHVDEAVGTECALLALLGEELGPTEILDWSGFDDDVAERWLQARMDAETPQGQAIRGLAPYLFAAGDDVDGDRAYDPAETGHLSFLFVPLVLGRRPIALLVASSHQPLEAQPVDRTSGSSQRSPARRRRHSTARGGSSPSSGSRRPCSRASCRRRCRCSRASSWRAGTCPARRRLRWVATGTTRSSFRTGGWASSWATSWAREYGRRRQWASSGTRFGLSRSTG